MSCWFTHTGRKARRPRETVPSTPPFFTLFFLCPLSATAGRLSLILGDLQLPLLTSNTTLLTQETVALCQDTQSYGCMKCIWNPCGVSVFLFKHIYVVLFVSVVSKTCISTPHLLCEEITKLHHPHFGPQVRVMTACCTPIMLVLGDCYIPAPALCMGKDARGVYWMIGTS